MKQFTTKELQTHLRRTEKELKAMKDLEKKLAAAKSSGNGGAKTQKAT